MAEKNNVYELVRNRRATKRFIPDFIVPEDKLHSITEAIRWTSMSYGVWNYRIIVVPKGQVKDDLAGPWLNQPSFIAASHVIIFVHDKEAKIRNHDLEFSFNSSIPESAAQVRVGMTNAVLDNWKTNNVNPTEWSSKQAYIGLGTAMIAAADVGIDTAPYEGFVRADVDAVLVKHGLLDGENETVAMGLALGKANMADPYVHFFEKTRMLEEMFTTIVKK